VVEAFETIDMTCIYCLMESGGELAEQILRHLV